MMLRPTPPKGMVCFYSSIPPRPASQFDLQQITEAINKEYQVHRVTGGIANYKLEKVFVDDDTQPGFILLLTDHGQNEYFLEQEFASAVEIFANRHLGNDKLRGMSFEEVMNYLLIEKQLENKRGNTNEPVD